MQTMTLKQISGAYEFDPSTQSISKGSHIEFKRDSSLDNNGTLYVEVNEDALVKESGDTSKNGKLYIQLPLSTSSVSREGKSKGNYSLFIVTSIPEATPNRHPRTGDAGTLDVRS